MPGLDRTGPVGEGPMTGGSRGNCTSAGRRFSRPVSTASDYGFKRGMACGKRGFRGGYGIRMRRGYSQNFETSSNELAALKAQSELIKKRISELEKSV